MRELTIHELDAELAEQLPARELMNWRGGGGISHSFNTTATAIAGSGNFSVQEGFINVNNVGNTAVALNLSL